MGWFWADAEPKGPVAPHPLPHGSDASPPPGCPMHKSSAGASLTAPSKSSSVPASACPYVPPDQKTPAPPADAPAPKSGLLDKLNPLNYMPSNLSQERAANQIVDLPTEREPSSIPRGDGGGNWEYPSPQQMYNAMLRKGYTDTPQDAVESMVAVHNFLNEGAWAEILEWERRFGPGILHGWKESRQGEEASQTSELLSSPWPVKDTQPPQLTRFMGRPGELTPKARMFQFLGQLWPSKFHTEPPFDRHDWYVQRNLPDGSSVERRYVIDYYEGEPEHGMPVFFLDVRPAIDTPSQAAERTIRWGRDVWWRAAGGSIREQMAAQKATAEAAAEAAAEAKTSKK
ncbi:cytochrome C1 heme lyase [Phyllosticta citriasiana]|uniref:cytochrome C1 heme lyase n=1 Tax=Phyllosticta citriasiana TaxID=595635 RepID=UPI0030FD2FFE